jgi:hypothetical protein
MLSLLTGLLSRRSLQQCRRYMLVCLVLFSLLMPTCVLASEGDIAPEYKKCVKACEQRQCFAHIDGQVVAVNPLPLYMRLMQWTCVDDCRHQCQQEISRQRVAQNQPVLQYHGKWPFIRIFGIQEPASVVFSIWNGYGHWRGLATVRERVKPGYYLRPVLVIYALVNINAWLWSSVFHTRDTPLTEKLDYFSAGLAILIGLYMGTCRVFYVRSARQQKIYLACVGVLFLLHVSYLNSGPRFDYTYNMAACATVGMLHNLIWCVWAGRQWKRRPYAWHIVVLVFSLVAAMLLELFDFPPWAWTFDAHSLWHAATAILVPYWYKFLLEDYDWEMRHGGPKAYHLLNGKPLKD